MAHRSTQLSVDPDTPVQRLSRETAKDLCNQWAREYPADYDGIHVKRFIWHVFSFQRYPSVSRHHALAEYEKHEAPDYLVLAYERKEALITSRRPTMASIPDFLVCPLNWAWTMAFTHEDASLGPYFALHRNYIRLQALNEKELRKRREVAAAKRRGWV